MQGPGNTFDCYAFRFPTFCFPAYASGHTWVYYSAPTFLGNFRREQAVPALQPSMCLCPDYLHPPRLHRRLHLRLRRRRRRPAVTSVALHSSLFVAAAALPPATSASIGAAVDVGATRGVRRPLMFVSRRCWCSTSAGIGWLPRQWWCGASAAAFGGCLREQPDRRYEVMRNRCRVVVLCPCISPVMLAAFNGKHQRFTVRQWIKIKPPEGGGAVFLE